MKTSMPCKDCFRCDALSIGLLAIIVLVLHRTAALGVSINVVSPPPVQQSGDTGRVCVALSSGGDQVAATENRLVWDANCASLVDKCVANSAHGKQLMSNQTTTSQLKAIVISLQDTNAIPDGELYCCTFRLDLSRGGSCCAIGIQDMGASDPEGGALGAAGRGGQICLASGAGSGGGLQGGTGPGQQAPLSADLGGAQQPPRVMNQPAGQEAAPQRAPGGGSTVLGGGTGGVPGGVGGVPGGVGGVPGGVSGVPGAAPQAPAQPGQLAQQQAEIPPPAAPGAGAARPQAPVPGAPEQAPVAAAATPGATAAPAAPAAPARPGAPAAKPAMPKPTIAAKAAVPAPTAASSGCSCEIVGSGSGYDGWSAFAALAVLLWARRRRI